jgi:hypothetical protein
VPLVLNLVLFWRSDYCFAFIMINEYSLQKQKCFFSSKVFSIEVWIHPKFKDTCTLFTLRMLKTQKLYLKLSKYKWNKGHSLQYWIYAPDGNSTWGKLECGIKNRQMKKATYHCRNPGETKCHGNGKPDVWWCRSK